MSALTWSALLLLLLGQVALDPVLRLALSVIAVLLAAPATVARARRSRLVGAVILSASLVLALVHYPAARRHYGRYLERARNRSVEPTPPSAGSQELGPHEGGLSRSQAR
jgi:hypothetical protein